MLGPVSGGSVFVIPARKGTAALGTGAGVMGGNSTFPRDVTTVVVTCAESVWDMDGLLYKEDGKWMNQCKAFYGT